MNAMQRAIDIFLIHYTTLFSTLYKEFLNKFIWKAFNGEHKNNFIKARRNKNIFFPFKNISFSLCQETE